MAHIEQSLALKRSIAFDYICIQFNSSQPLASRLRRETSFRAQPLHFFVPWPGQIGRGLPGVRLGVRHVRFSSVVR